MSAHKLVEHDLDAAIADHPCDERCAQGRNHACPMPEEFPPANWKTAAVAIVAVIGSIVVSGLLDRWAS